jgi:hypothetical protein
MPHKFAIGGNVELHPATGRAVDAECGPYVVTKRSPGPRGKFQYRIKHPTEPHERIAGEAS